MAEVNAGSIDAAELVGELNELLQLDLDAIHAYAAARDRLRSDAYREAVLLFIEDHERHVDELTRLVRGYGGRPADGPAATDGPFQRAVAAAAAAGRHVGDRGLLLACKAQERRGRDRYRRASQNAYTPEVAAVLRRATNDETAHYAWALEALDDVRRDGGAVSGRVERALEGANARVLDVIEGAERSALAAAAGARRGLRGGLAAHPLRAAVAALAAGLVAAVVTAGGAARYSDGHSNGDVGSDFDGG